MRILHVGFGFTPWLVNGLLIHLEDVMEAQARTGEEIGYFFAARQLPGLRRPLLHRWRRRGVAMFELMNSPVVVGRDRGSPDPDHDLRDSATETAFATVLDGFRPGVVHVHDLGGLPSSILPVAQDRDLPVVMTLHDYQALCPTIRLYDVQGENCERAHPGTMCVACCARAPLDNRRELERTVAYTRGRFRAHVPYLDAALQRPAVLRVSDAGIRFADRLFGFGAARADRPPAPDLAAARRRRPTAQDYDRRREVNVARLNRLSAVTVPSDGAGEVWRRHGVRAELIRTLPINPLHVERLRPKHPARPHPPVRFATLNGASSTEKGADLIADAVDLLAAQGLEHRFRLRVYGGVARHVRLRLAAHPALELAGDYEVGELDRLLDEVDVGLMPSVWQEVLGFAGLEFIAKGIPVIGSARGGVPQYVRPGQTGWLNLSGSAQELAEVMAELIDHPEEIERLQRSTVALRDELIHPLSRQLADLDALYARLTPSAAPAR